MPDHSPAVTTGLTIRSVETVAVEVPMRFPLGTSAATVREAPLLLVDVLTDEGVVGRSYLFCYRRSGARALSALIEDAVEVVSGLRAAPVEIGAILVRRFALLGVAGLARMALAAIDGALWDAVAKAAGLPLATLLGAAPRALRAYNSSGLGLMVPKAAADEAEALLDRGFAAVKLRLGYPSLAEDLAVARAVRDRVPAGVEIFADYNQALGLQDALRRGHALAGEGIGWIEEPIRHDDLAGHARLVRDLTLPVQAGENFDGPGGMARALDAGACDLVMPDFARIGGVTGWMQASALAATHGVPMSSHLFPEVSAHLLAATPTAHWLEYVDWADPIQQDPLRIVDGHAVVPDRPGTGLAWDQAAVARFSIA
ncbi:enolase C-terminal domain-like protein [Methylobacterium sp. J-070]|uniref:enolase C-terminal domain-like protein n=1 Tax=Methylobacterium sp. J-070 TaxID=2836650 RepID=UPI001FBB7830|nr:enolase C-terminal domain-like protein [Methylobacterium sp. J-070]MCJ2048932.1 mandelate racemase [Methylobacterium sp. J-070]